MNIYEQLEQDLENPDKRKKIIEVIKQSGLFDNLAESMADKDDWNINVEAFMDEENSVCESMGDYNFKDLPDYNYFESIEECSTWAKRINALHKLRLIANHLNEGWKPDWGNGVQDKYRVWRDMDSDTYATECNMRNIESMIYFKDEESAHKAIKLMGKESLDALFGVES